MEEKIKAKLDELRVFLQSHGGDLEFIDFDEASKKVTLRLQGACGGCPHAAETLKLGIEAALREEIDPEIVVEREAQA